MLVRGGTLSCSCPAEKSKNFVFSARNTPLRSVFLSAWEAKVNWSCSARPAQASAFPSAFEFFRPPKYLKPYPSPRERPGNTKTGQLLARDALRGVMGIPGNPRPDGGRGIEAGSRPGYGLYEASPLRSARNMLHRANR